MNSRRSGVPGSTLVPAPPRVLDLRVRASFLWTAFFDRLRPSRWGPIPVFLALAFGLRFLLGEALPPPNPRLVATGALLLLGIYLLGPMPWQWDGRDHGRPSLLRGCFQALAGNALWIAVLVGAAWAWERVSPGGPPIHPLLRTLADRAGMSPWLLQGASVLPLAFLVGWFIASKEAAESDRREARRRQAALETEARQAQAQALQAQLDPHVLYNALGGLSELARRDPAATERALLDLSDLYRSLTELGRRERSRLGDERRLLERQLRIEALRLGDRLQVHWDWPADLDALEVPPLLVQPLVENAVKHGLAPHEAGGSLDLRAGLEPGGRLTVEVANTGCPLDPHWREGTGLSNLERRLAILGPGHRLTLRQDGAWTRATLSLAPAWGG